MEIFDQNTLCSFRNFLNDEIHLSGDWRVALCEIIFPTKLQHVVIGAYSLKGYEDSQRISSDANIISRPYSGEKFSFMTGNFDTGAQLLFRKSHGTKAYYGEFPADLYAGKHLIIIYKNIIEYQNSGEAEAPLLRVIDSKQRLKNGSVCELEPTQRIVFFKF